MPDICLNKAYYSFHNFCCMNYLNTNKLRQGSFIVLLVALGVLLFLELRAFIPALLGALTFYILVRRYLLYLTEKRKWRPGLAATLLIFLTFLVVLVPVWILVTMLSSRINYAIQNSNQVLESIQKIASQLQQRYQIELLSGENLGKASGMVANTLPNILGATFNSLTTILIMYFLLYFMLTGSRQMEGWLLRYTPLKKENKEWIKKELKNLVVSNALGIPLIAVLQGVVGLLGYFLLGVKDPWFWFIVTCITAMLPFLGAALAYVPLSIVLLVQGPTWKGVVLLIYGFGVIGTVDNIFRIVLQRKLGDVHPVITLFGVIIGVNMFGFIGLIFGPILISMFILLVRIYINEFADKTP